MFLHLMNFDEGNKFFSSWKTLFESVAPGQNIYYQYNPAASSKTTGIVRSFQDLQEVISLRNDWDGVLFSPMMSKIVHAVPKQIPICVYTWGEWTAITDPIRRPPKTKKLLLDLKYGRKKPFVLPFLFCKNRLRDVFCMLSLWHRSLKRAYRTADIAAGLFFTEFQYAQKKGFFRNDCEFMHGIVGTGKNNIKTELPPFDTMPDIQVGNSAFSESGHLDVFEKLTALNLQNRRIVVPLSYGPLDYREKVIERGRELFGEQFFPILDMMPFSQYTQTLSSCGIYISNQLYPMGLGNTHIALRTGKKLYLPKTSIVYQEYIKKGLAIYSIEDDLTKDSSEVYTYSSENQIKNQKLLIEISSPEKNIQCTKKILERLIEIKKRSCGNEVPLNK